MRLIATTAACAAAGLLGLSVTATSLAQMDQNQQNNQASQQPAQGEQQTITGQLVYLHTFITGEPLVSNGATAGQHGAFGQSRWQQNSQSQTGQTEESQQNLTGQDQQNQPGQQSQSQTEQPGQMGQTTPGMGAAAGEAKLAGPAVLAVHTDNDQLVILDVTQLHQAMGAGQFGQTPGQTPGQSDQSQTPGQSDQAQTPGQTPGQTNGQSQYGQTSDQANGQSQFGATPGQSATGQTAQQQWQEVQRDAQRFLNRQVKIEGTLYKKAGVQYLVANSLEPATASARQEESGQQAQPSGS